jgi:hypothetical protein
MKKDNSAKDRGPANSAANSLPGSVWRREIPLPGGRYDWFNGLTGNDF